VSGNEKWGAFQRLSLTPVSPTPIFDVRRMAYHLSKLGSRKWGQILLSFTALPALGKSLEKKRKGGPRRAFLRERGGYGVNKRGKKKTQS